MDTRGHGGRNSVSYRVNHSVPWRDGVTEPPLCTPGIVAARVGSIALPRPDGGGTWQAVRVALALGQPVLVLPHPVGEGADAQVAGPFARLEQEAADTRA